MTQNTDSRMFTPEAKFTLVTPEGWNQMLTPDADSRLLALDYLLNTPDNTLLTWHCWLLNAYYRQLTLDCWLKTAESLQLA